MVFQQTYIIEKYDDKTLYELSYPDDYESLKDFSIAFAEGKETTYFFREIKYIHERFPRVVPRFKRTGKIWRPNKGGEFTIVECNFIVID